MESSVLPLLLLLMSLSYPGHTQGAKPVLHVQPDEHVFRGETVTFTCDIQTETDTEWTYSYIKNGDIRSSNTSTQEFRISTVYESDIGKYSCRGEKSSDPPISVISDAVTLTVSATPKPVLTVMPQSSVFIGDTVNLSCEFTHSTGWKIHWYKNVKHIKAYSAQTETLSDVKVSDGGKYHCRAQRGNYYTHYSHTVMITVTVSHSADQISVLHTLSSLLAVCPYLIVTVMLVFKYYRARGERDQYNPQMKCLFTKTITAEKSNMNV
ncbi:basement membrane-specific heparan sulfate proteoglycan core protein-like isoform X2 [Myxocyprinus asiaticus]|uniref:basement membrane-specific heparan sulfate proteoglycan core protein-like isoform X2 n=1 Tax=Myxocyprinus asiaticus TaxID=70543 RepID=UPI0022229FB3|nr:basement membrane-specific heparan sulfate proteoglycan core protein-like isoform X2 [Myxocyprinus asiaticus]